VILSKLDKEAASGTYEEMKRVAKLPFTMPYHEKTTEFGLSTPTAFNNFGCAMEREVVKVVKAKSVSATVRIVILVAPLCSEMIIIIK